MLTPVQRSILLLVLRHVYNSKTDKIDRRFHMSVKEIFLERVHDRLYRLLRDGIMREWDVADVINFSRAVIKENKAEINAYLQQNPVRLDNINKAVDEIVKKVLLPLIEIK